MRFFRKHAGICGDFWLRDCGSRVYDGRFRPIPVLATRWNFWAAGLGQARRPCLERESGVRGTRVPATGFFRFEPGCSAVEPVRNRRRVSITRPDRPPLAGRRPGAPGRRFVSWLPAAAASSIIPPAATRNYSGICGRKRSGLDAANLMEPMTRVSPVIFLQYRRSSPPLRNTSLVSGSASAPRSAGPISWFRHALSASSSQGASNFRSEASRNSGTRRRGSRGEDPSRPEKKGRAIRRNRGFPADRFPPPRSLRKPNLPGVATRTRAAPPLPPRLPARRPPRRRPAAG